MSTSGSPVFNEVLNIQVDTSQFAAQMAQVEHIYNDHLVKMQQSAKQFDGFEQVGKQIQGATSYVEQFGAAFEKALIRVPARLAVMALIGAAIATVVEPIRLLNDGMENLEGHSSAFNEMRESLKDTASHIESVAATPIFAALLEQMNQLGAWFKDNKVYVDNIALSFGNMATSLLKAAVEFATTDLAKGAFKGLAELGVSLAYIFGSTLVSLRAIAELLPQLGTYLGAMAGNTNQIFSTDFSHKDQATDVTDRIDAIIKKHDEDQHKLTELAASMDKSIEGQSNQNIPAVPDRNTETLADPKTKFNARLAETKRFYDEQKNIVHEAISDKTLSHQDAAPKIHAIITAEEKAIDALVSKYKNLAVEVGHLTGKTPADISKAQASYSRADATGGDALDKQDSAARRDANSERLADQKIFSAAFLKIADDDARAEVALIKRAVAEGSMTREAGVDADIAEEQRRHFSAMGEIAGRVGAPGSREAAERNTALAEEMSRNLRTQTALTAAHEEAVTKDADALDKFNVAQLNAMITAKEANASEAEALGHRREHLALTKEIIQLKQAEANLELQTAKDKRSSDIAGSPEDMKDAVVIAQLQAKIAQLQTQANNAKYGSTALGKYIENEDLGKSNSPTEKFASETGLDAASTDYGNANGGLQKFAAGLEGATGVMKSLSTAVADAVAAYKQSGALGAAASLLNNKSVTSGIGSIADSMSQNVGDVADKVGSMAPVIGPMIGQMFSAITTMFSQGIQTMVNNINQQIAAINQQAQLKQIGIQQQIAELKAEEQTAINELGGKKKASSQLKTILTSLNSQIAQLQYQAQQTVQQFNDMATAGGLGNMTGIMASWASTWEQINQQVEQYIQAGGSIATAAEYMNQQLKAQRQQLQDQVNQGDATAINDAIQLNNLLTQRVQMMKDEAATEFGMLNSDSMERRTASAVQLGTALTKQRNAFALQLQQTNSQIALDQSRVAAEGKIFSIATSLAALQAQSNALNLAALDQQLKKMQDMQTLINATNGMVFTSASINPNAGLNGTQAGIPGEPTVAGPINMTVTINGNVTEKNAATLGSEIAKSIRSGRTTLTAH
jgi:hypothetical protein